MGTLTKMYTKPIFKIEMGLTFDLNEEKVVILEDGLLYNVKYVDSSKSGDTSDPLKEITGRLCSIKKIDSSISFNPFYNGEVYLLQFDCSRDFESIRIPVYTSSIRDIDLIVLSDDSEEDKDNGSDEGPSDGPTDDGSKDDTKDDGVSDLPGEDQGGNTSDSETSGGQGTESGDSADSDALPESGDTTTERDGESDVSGELENPEEIIPEV